MRYDIYAHTDTDHAWVLLTVKPAREEGFVDIGVYIATIEANYAEDAAWRVLKALEYGGNLLFKGVGR